MLNVHVTEIMKLSQVIYLLKTDKDKDKVQSQNKLLKPNILRHILSLEFVLS